jgi:chemotaxis protein methyltransferase CheR
MYYYSIKPISDVEFQLIRRLIYQKTGVFMNDHKKILVTNRLRKRLEHFGFNSYKKYYDFITKDPAGYQEIIEFINCLTTNETYFFRHGEQLEYIVEILMPDINIEKSSKYIQVWSAACSSGEEPYSLAMIIREKWINSELDKVKIVASDINREMIEKARIGTYKSHAVQRMSKFYRDKYFKKDILRQEYYISDQVKSMVNLYHHNLLNQFNRENIDIILCRNVLIYFDRVSKTRILENLHQTMRRGGYLITGYAESLFRNQNLFQYIKPTIYRKIC